MAQSVFFSFEPWFQAIERINAECGQPFGPDEITCGWEPEDWETYFRQGYLPEQAFDVALKILEGQQAA